MLPVGQQAVPALANEHEGFPVTLPVTGEAATPTFRGRPSCAWRPGC